MLDCSVIEFTSASGSRICVSEQALERSKRMFHDFSLDEENEDIHLMDSLNCGDSKVPLEDHPGTCKMIDQWNFPTTSRSITNTVDTPASELSVSSLLDEWEDNEFDDALSRLPVDYVNSRTRSEIITQKASNLRRATNNDVVATPRRDLSPSFVRKTRKNLSEKLSNGSVECLRQQPYFSNNDQLALNNQNLYDRLKIEVEATKRENDAANFLEHWDDEDFGIMEDGGLIRQMKEKKQDLK